MTKFVVKESQSGCFPGKLYAEEEGNPSNWRWLSPTEQYTVGAEFSEVDPIHVADDDGMQAAIGAAHVEAHDEDEGARDEAISSGRYAGDGHADGGRALRRDRERGCARAEVRPEPVGLFRVISVVEVPCVECELVVERGARGR